MSFHYCYTNNKLSYYLGPNIMVWLVFYLQLCLSCTHINTHKTQKTPTQQQTMDNGDLFRLGDTNCVQVWDCVG